MEFIIRKAGAEDVAGIMKVMEEAAGDKLHPQWFAADDEEYVRTHLSHGSFTLVAETETNQIAGFLIVKKPAREENLGLYLDFEEEKLEKVMVMDSAAVSQPYRGNHLQWRLVEEAEKIIDKKETAYLLCTVHPQNRYSLSNMQNHGYEVQKAIKCYGGLDRYVLMKAVL